MADTSTSTTGRWMCTDEVTGTRRYYLRRASDDGERVILELHLDAGEQHVTAAIHAYTEPDGHTANDLDGCRIRGTLPGREHYDSWLLAGRDDDHAFQVLAEVDVPALVPGIPSHAADRIAELEAEVERLRAQVDNRGVPRVRSGAALPPRGRRGPHMYA